MAFIEYLCEPMKYQMARGLVSGASPPAPPFCPPRPLPLQLQRKLCAWPTCGKGETPEGEGKRANVHEESILPSFFFPLFFFLYERFPFWLAQPTGRKRSTGGRAIFSLPPTDPADDCSRQNRREERLTVSQLAVMLTVCVNVPARSTYIASRTDRHRHLRELFRRT